MEQKKFNCNLQFPLFDMPFSGFQGYLIHVQNSKTLIHILCLQGQ